jgi:hypothetical protein
MSAAAAQIPSPPTYIPSMSSSSSAAEQIPSPPTYRFRPKKRELVEFYLLPRARGQDPFPGVIFEDDAAGSSLPWDLFERHGVGSEDEAYFIVRSSEAKKPGARQDRACDGGVGTWKTQSSVEKSLRVRGERIRVHVSNLNLHMGKGKNSGSVGWVMHEYTIAAPPCSSLVKICHITFSGHGRMRMRVPNGQQVRQSSGHARVGATVVSGSSALPCSGAMLDQGSSGVAYASSALPCSGAMLNHGSSGVAYASGDEEPSHLVLIDDDNFRQSPLLGSSDSQGFSSAASEQYTELEAQVLTTEQQDIVVPQLMGQQSTMPVARQLSAGELEFWSSIGVDVQSNNSFDQEQSTGVQSSWVAPNTGAMATGVHSSWVVPNNGAMATGAQSSWVVPNTGVMATGVQSSWVAVDLDDFCRSILTNVQTNCAALDFGNVATGTLGSGCSMLCK